MVLIVKFKKLLGKEKKEILKNERNIFKRFKIIIESILINKCSESYKMQVLKVVRLIHCKVKIIIYLY